MRDALGKYVHLERLDDTPDALQPDALQQHLHQLLQRYCEDDQEEEEEKEEEGHEEEGEEKGDEQEGEEDGDDDEEEESFD